MTVKPRVEMEHYDTPESLRGGRILVIDYVKQVRQLQKIDMVPKTTQRRELESE